MCRLSPRTERHRILLPPYYASPFLFGAITPNEPSCAEQISVAQSPTQRQKSGAAQTGEQCEHYEADSRSQGLGPVCSVDQRAIDLSSSLTFAIASLKYLDSHFSTLLHALIRLIFPTFHRLLLTLMNLTTTPLQPRDVNNPSTVAHYQKTRSLHPAHRIPLLHSRIHVPSQGENQ
jgi:hypothetical protein